MYFCTRNITRESWDKMRVIKQKQFSTIYGSYKPVLGFPTISKQKLWPVSSEYFDLLICPFPMCCLLHFLLSFQLQTPFLAPIPSCRCLTPSHLGRHSPSICLDCAAPPAQRFGGGTGKYQQCPSAKKRCFFHI